MIRYEVTLDCSPTIAPELERWMRNTHIPAMLATGCFVAIHFDRAVDQDQYRTVYQAATEPQLGKYMDEHSNRMRDAFRRQFPHGVAVSRETWLEIQRWGNS